MSNKYIPTGNNFISIPKLANANGSIENLNFLYFRYNSLIEIMPSENNYIIKPFITVDGTEIYLKDLNWYLDIYWIPHWEYMTDNYIIKGSILLPENSKSFIYSFELKNKTEKELKIKIGFKGNISGLSRIVYASEKMNLMKKIFIDNWENNKMVINFFNETTILSFVIMGETKLDYIGWNKNIDYNLKSEPLILNQFDTINYCIYKDIFLSKEESKFYRFYFSSGIEQSSAIASGIHLNRIDYGKLYNDTITDLRKKIKDIRDIQLNKVMNTNLLFNYFYSFGDTIDTEELVCVTSRSPLYYVNAAYWDRDIFLWAFPGLLLADANKGKSALDYFFKYQLKNVGIHSRYINGTILEQGFELDELCAPVIGLDYYLNFTKDFDYLKNEYVLKGLETIIKKIISKKNPDFFLFETFLLPTDDMEKYPYVTYDNVLVWKVFKIMEHLSEYFGYTANAAKFKEYSIKLKESIYAHLIIETQGKKYFAWSTDLKGNSRFYDEAAGSLVLLNYYGFCDKSSDIYINTLRELYSDTNKFFVQTGEFKELANLHTPELTPWILSAINSALSIRKNEVKDFFRNVVMDDGIACESIYPDTGKVATGRHFATCAGFLAYAIWYAYK